MGSTLLRTKLYIPTPGPVLVWRGDLVERLNEGLDGDLSLVVAPVGYGKTTLVAEWVSQLEMPAAWLTLDRNDNDLATFLAYLIAAIQTVFPDACSYLRVLAASLQLPNPEHLALVFSNEIDDLPQQFVLVLDDYHQIIESKIHQFLDEVLRHPPLQMHLVLATRTEPPLSLGRLRANRKLNELRIQELRFSADEADALLKQALGAQGTEQVVKLLFKHTEGWPAGLHLGALSLKSAANKPGILEGLERGVNRYIMDYLFEQVLEQQTPAVRQFLVKTSILDRVSQPLAQAVTQTVSGGGAGSGADGVLGAQPVTLDALAQAGLFLNLVDGVGEWYRYHALFRELLRHQLPRLLPAEEIAGLHLRASHWLCHHDLYDEALEHGLAAGDEAWAVRIVVDHLLQWLGRENWRTINYRLNLFPTTVIEKHPWLLLAKAMMLQMQFRWHPMLPLLEQAEARLAAMEGELPAEERKLLRGYIDFLLSVHWSYAGDAQRTITAGMQAMQALPEEHLHARGLVLIALTMALQTNGEHAAAEKLVQAEIARVSINGADPRLVLRPLLCWMSLQFAEGYPVRAGQISEALLERAARCGSQVDELWAHLSLGNAAYELNDLDKAAYHFARGAAQRFSGHVRGVHECLVGLVLTYQAQGKLEEAKGALAIMVDMHRELLNPALTIESASLYRRLGITSDAGQKRTWHEGVPVETAVWYGWLEIPAETEIRLALADPDADLEATWAALRELIELAEALHKPRRKAEFLALEAVLLERCDRRVEALRSLEEALLLGEPRQLVRSIIDAGPDIAKLLALAAVAPDYRKQLMAACAADAGRQAQADAAMPAPVQPALTRREREVLALLGQQRTDREIAATLVIAPVTVRTHIENLSEKLQAKGRRAIVLRAREYRLLD